MAIRKELPYQLTSLSELNCVVIVGTACQRSISSLVSGLAVVLPSQPL